MTIDYNDADSLLPEYSEWLTRLDATYRSVTFCCLHRLHDRSLAKSVGLRVAAGLIAKPTVFQFSGLPFSGRIGVLAEHWITEAKHGRIDDAGSWDDLQSALRDVPLELQQLFVLACVWGHDDPHVAAALACDEADARDRRRVMLERFELLSGGAVSARRPAEERP